MDEPNAELVAACGLYCGACKRYRAQRCPGCAENQAAWWCKIRSCTAAKGIATCADCDEHSDLAGCGLLNNRMSKLVGLVLNSDRIACLDTIRALGLEAYAQRMAAAGRQSLPRRG